MVIVVTTNAAHNYFCARTDTIPGTPHCAINDLNAPEDRLPRESIEVVAFVFTPD